MAGRKNNIPASLQVHSNGPSDSDDGGQQQHQSELGSNVPGNRPNGRVYSPDYVSPPCYQPASQVPGSQSQYQQPFNARTGAEITEERNDASDHITQTYYVQDNRTIGKCLHSLFATISFKIRSAIG